MTHEEIKILISAYFDGEVTPSEKNIVKEHLSACQSCQKDFKMYKTMSSSLSKWSNETLSPDEEINVQRRFEQRREPMFTKRTVVTLATTLALTIIIGTAVQKYIPTGFNSSRLRSTSGIITTEQYPGTVYSPQPTRNLSYLKNVPSSMFWAQGLQANDSLSTKYVPGSTLSSGGFQNMASSIGTNYSVQSPYGYIPLNGTEKYTPVFVPQPQNSATNNTLSMIYPESPLNYAPKDIKNAQISLSVKDFQRTQIELENLIAKFNGVVVHSRIDKSSDGAMEGTATFKVLSKNFETVLWQLRKLGEVQSEDQSGDDVVAEQYANAQTRLENFKTIKANLSKILNKENNSTDDIVEFQREIAGVDADIAALEKNIKYYGTQSDMAMLTVSFTEKNKNLFKEFDASNKWASTLRQSYEGFMDTFSVILILLSSFLPVLIWVIIFWGIYLLISKIFKK